MSTMESYPNMLNERPASKIGKISMPKPQAAPKAKFPTVPKIKSIKDLKKYNASKGY